MRGVILTVLAAIGLIFTGYIIYRGNREPVYHQQIAQPFVGPFEYVIVGQALVESAYKNISIGSSFADVITEIYIEVGDQVKKGNPLFKTDTRKLEALYELAVKQQEVAQAEYNNQDEQFDFYRKLGDRSAVSKQAFTTALYNKEVAQKKLISAKAEAEVHKMDLERSIVRAPIDGEVLQVNIRVGQYAFQSEFRDTPLILFGDTDYYHVRVDIDEEDAWRYKHGAPAYAALPSNGAKYVAIEYVYTEPYIIPKKSLTGNASERTDTRVLQVVYRMEKDALPVHVGQLLDVYIKARSHEASS